MHRIKTKTYTQNIFMGATAPNRERYREEYDEQNTA